MRREERMKEVNAYIDFPAQLLTKSHVQVELQVNVIVFQALSSQLWIGRDDLAGGEITHLRLPSGLLEIPVRSQFGTPSMYEAGSSLFLTSSWLW